MQQSGFAIGRTTPRAKVFLDGQMVARASDDGFFYLGFDRDAGPHARVRIDARGADLTRQLQIDRAEYDVQRIKGLRRVYQGQASPQLEARIAEESRRKAAAFASVTDRDDFRTGFSAPLRDFRVTARFGGQRIVDGRPRPPHYGIDLAAPQGSVIRAPADGRIAFVRPDMHFEGGLTLIDHGQGLISCYLHQSRLDVALGQRVRRGDPLGRVGMTGRATGPHLCWRMKWRDRNLDPSLMIGARVPESLA